MEKFSPSKFTCIPIFTLFFTLIVGFTVSIYQLRSTHAVSPAYTPIHGSFVAPSIIDKLIGLHPGSAIPFTFRMKKRGDNEGSTEGLLGRLYITICLFVDLGIA